MTSEPEGFEQRIGQMVAAVGGSRKALARLAGMSDATLLNWSRGLGVRPTKLAEFAEATGVPLAWLRDGEGDPDAALARLVVRGGAAPSGARRKLQQARERANLSHAQLAKRTRLSPDYLAKLEAGAIGISERTIDTLCRELPGLKKEDLMAGSDDALVISEDGAEATHGSQPRLRLPPGMTGRYVPLLSMAEAGPEGAAHSDALYNYTGIFAPNVDDRTAFAISVSGNSMEPELHQGDVVICSPEARLANGDAAVVRTRSEQTFIKYWRQTGEKVTLESANNDYGPLHFPLAEIAGAWKIVRHVSSRSIKKHG